MHDFIACQNEIVNRQLVSPLCLNNLLLETSLDESNMLIIYKHLDAKKKHSLGV